MKLKYKIRLNSENFSCEILFMHRWSTYKKLGLGLYYLFFYHIAIGQFTDDFSTLSIHPEWQGNRELFSINPLNQLQLKASEAGTASLYRHYEIPKDTLQTEFFFQLDFDPSDNNQLRIQVMSDLPGSNIQNGYEYRIGENGSMDNIKLYAYTSGVATQLGGGNLSAVSVGPISVFVKTIWYPDGQIKTLIDYNGGQLYTDEFDVFDSNWVNIDQAFFAIFCKYTASRVDDFIVDDIRCIQYEKDTIGPKLLSYLVESDSTLLLVYDEALDQITALNQSNYILNQGLKVTEIKFLSPNEVLLTFDQILSSGQEYVLEIKNIQDLNNNTAMYTIQFFKTDMPLKNDLIINEVLTDPYTGGEDFIEIMNISNKFLQLKNLNISNDQKEESTHIKNNYVLRPNHIVAISEDTSFLKEKYKTPLSAQFILNALPSFNVSSANISLNTIQGQDVVSIDSFDYDESFHFSLIDETKGVSLERISTSTVSNDVNNWHSASSEVGYATPGYTNSVVKNSNIDLSGDFFSTDYTLMTPNNDGSSDFIIFKYNMPDNGFVATIKIYAIGQGEVRTLADNVLLDTEGQFKWDGLNNQGSPSDTGWYICRARFFNPDGRVLEKNLAISVAYPF